MGKVEMIVDIYNVLIVLTLIHSKLIVPAG